MNRTEKEKACQLLDTHYEHLQNATPEHREEQRTFYDGLMIAYEHLLMGTGEELHRSMGKHTIIKRG